MGDAWTAADADFMAGCWDEDDGDASEGVPPPKPASKPSPAGGGSDALEVPPQSPLTALPDDAASGDAAANGDDLQRLVEADRDAGDDLQQFIRNNGADDLIEAVAAALTDDKAAAALAAVLGLTGDGCGDVCACCPPADGDGCERPAKAPRLDAANLQIPGAFATRRRTTPAP